MGLGQLGGQAVEVEDEVVRIGMYQWMELRQLRVKPNSDVIPGETLPFFSGCEAHSKLFGGNGGFLMLGMIAPCLATHQIVFVIRSIFPFFCKKKPGGGSLVAS